MKWNETTIEYTNHRGVLETRKVLPFKVRFGSTEWHKEEQWLLKAWCYERKAEREFAVKDIHNHTLESLQQLIPAE